MAPNVKDIDLYALLEILPDSTTSEIKKAYRKKALRCHPDKHPDDPVAAEEWENLSKALEILTDKEARAAYDKILKAKKAAELRNRALDAKRKKVKYDLEAREAAAKEEKEDAVFDAQKLEQEIKRLREEGSRQLEEEKELLKQQLKEEEKLRKVKAEQRETPKLKVKWKSKKADETNGGYSYDILFKAFSKYGVVNTLIMSRKRNGTAIVEFRSQHSAEVAVQHEVGITSNPLQVSWISGQPTTTLTSTHKCQAATHSSDVPTGSDFESMVLERLRQAAAAQTKKEDKTEVQQKIHIVEQSHKDTEAANNKGENDLFYGKDYESVMSMRLRQAEERQKLIEKLQQEDNDD